MKRLICLLYLSFFWANFASASAIYNYSGNNYTTILTGSSYDTSMNVSGSFSLDSVLVGGLSNYDITGLTGFSFSFSDGLPSHFESSGLGLTINSFEIGTDLDGKIIEWHIDLSDAGYGPYSFALPHTLVIDEFLGDAASYSVGNFCDTIINPDCSPFNTDTASAISRVSTGISANQVWTIENSTLLTPIPEPSTFLLLGGGLVCLAFLAHRRRKE